NGSCGIAEQAGERGADAGLRPCAFENDAIEDLNLIKSITLGVKEPSPLVGRGFDDRVVVVGEWDLRPVLLEQILINVESGTKGLECRLQPFNCILLFGMVETLVVDAGDSQYHANVPALSQKGSLIPNPIQVYMVIERSCLFPRLDDLIDSQHQTTSTR